MAKIRHIAIATVNPERLAQFYIDVFDMKLIHKTPTGGVFISDGYITLAIVPNRAEDMPSGINHFGLDVEDTAEIARRMAKYDVPPITKRPSIRPYAEHRGADPDGNLFDVSEHGYQRVELQDERDQRMAREAPEKVGA